MTTYLLAYFDALCDVRFCWLLLTRDDGRTAREDRCVLGCVLRSYETSGEETIKRGSFSRGLVIRLHARTHLGLELETLLLELLEDREILSVDTFETLNRLLDIIGQSLDVPRRASDETLVVAK